MKKLLFVFWIALIFAPCSQSQDEQTARKLFEDAIQAMGGDAYLKVTDITIEGQQFGFDSEGSSSLPEKYFDYTKIPDKSRTETGNSKKDRDIVVFNLGTNEGWIVEGQKGVRNATPEEMEEFKKLVKHDLGMICRFRYKDPENRIFYLGPGEGKDVTLEMVKLVDQVNDEVIVYFDRISKLPAKIEYYAITKNGVRRRVVDEYSQWFVKQGVNTPLRIDSYINGHRNGQNFIIKITYNSNLPDSFFGKPVPLK
jgi:hypothetical protein